MNEEIWLTDNGLKYFYSNQGQIRDKDGNPVSPRKDKDGYLIINDNGLKKVHRIIATLFIPNEFNYSEVNHLDTVRTNNSVSNLRWVTHKDNCVHSAKLGHYGQHFKKLSQNQADAIRSKYNSNAKKKKQKNKEYTYRSLAEEYGVHHETIRQIILNNTYVKEGGEVL